MWGGGEIGGEGGEERWGRGVSEERGGREREEREGWRKGERRETGRERGGVEVDKE